MAFAEDLLKQAFLLARKEPKNPSEASLRRSVSTAYYALFHLLVRDASANWRRSDTRDYLARAFDHATMKKASTRIENADYTGIDPALASKLKSVGRAFRELQEQRHLADYSYATKWDRVGVLSKIEQARSAFVAWESIRKEYLAQRYLVALLVSYKED